MSPTAPFLAPERDDSHRFGRGKSATTYYLIPGWMAGSINNTLALTANFDRYFPVFLDTPMLIDQIAFEVTTLSAGNARVGLYRANADMQPMGAPLADSGNISTGTTGVKTYTPGTALYCHRGRYLAVINCDATPTIRSPLGIYIGGAITDPALGTTGFLQEWRVSRSYAAFPTPGTAWDTVTGAAVPKHGIFFRVTAL